jgi:hypothetical protein
MSEFGSSPETPKKIPASLTSDGKQETAGTRLSGNNIPPTANDGIPVTPPAVTPPAATTPQDDQTPQDTTSPTLASAQRRLGKMGISSVQGDAPANASTPSAGAPADTKSGDL